MERARDESSNFNDLDDGQFYHLVQSCFRALLCSIGGLATGSGSLKDISLKVMIPDERMFSGVTDSLGTDRLISNNGTERFRNLRNRP